MNMKALFFVTVLLCVQNAFGGSVIDAKHRLQWQDTLETEEFFDIWKNARSHCEGLHLDGYDDWRLPTKEELVGLARSKELKASFKHLQQSVYWSGEDDPQDDLNAITVFMGNGFVSTDDKCNDNYMICVRRVLSTDVQSGASGTR